MTYVRNRGYQNHGLVKENGGQHRGEPQLTVIDEHGIREDHAKEYGAVDPEPVIYELKKRFIRSFHINNAKLEETAGTDVSEVDQGRA